ncbi:glycosyltransferase family 2 protein [Marinilabiliaceae bacterium JC017]|nr:glycosyltransferase family 2 protein [Marinilabiliaceae bacterium JC017]
MRISVVLPVRNEEKYIVSTIESILNQDVSMEDVEIIIADGMSTDRTRACLKEIIENHANIILIDNPEKITSTGLNRAIKIAKGEFIIRMDAHSIYPCDYISKLIEKMSELDADNVGGIIKTVPANASVKALAISFTMSHPFGVGNSYFRIGSNKIIEVDTVPFGCFRKHVFQKIGLFDEDLIRNQDDEFNARMINNGFKLFLIPGIEIRYFGRDNFNSLFVMFYQYGLFKPLVNKKLGKPATLRQLVPPLFVLFLVVGLVLVPLGEFTLFVFSAGIITYVLLNAFFSFSVSKSISTATYMMYSFFLIHFSYGLGYIQGILDHIIFKKQVNKNIKLSH